jgi:hypothetical protein
MQMAVIIIPCNFYFDNFSILGVINQKIKANYVYKQNKSVICGLEDT